LDWPRDRSSLALGEYPLGLHTQLLQFRLSVGGIQCTWLQCVDVTPPLDEDRDRHAIAKHLGTADFLAWIAALMTGEPNGGGSDDPWNKPPGHGPPEPNGLSVTNLLTFDAMLGCWARDNVLFGRIADRVESYLGPVVAHAATLSQDDRQRLSDFQSVWDTVSYELLKEH
jgi:hypothetical protein